MITSLSVRHMKWPLVVPYHLSYRTFHEFEPYLVEVWDDEGRHGFGDGHVSPGSSAETREGAWSFMAELARGLIGLEPAEAKNLVLTRFEESKVAATALVTAMEHLEDSPLLAVPDPIRLPLLAPLNSMDPAAIPAEVEAWLEKGYGTFKIKVGKDVDKDLIRIATTQKAAAGRASFRIDANRAYDRNQGCRFASSLDPTGIELFEQPCEADDWDANAAVAAASVVPLMLDEPICTLADIDRAAALDGVGLCKLKLKRFGSLQRLKEGLDRVRDNGMEPVLGDGLGSEIAGWMEACVAQTTIRNAGEFNGYLKTRDGLFTDPLGFEQGSLVMPAGYAPRMDPDALNAHTLETVTFPA